MPSSALQAYFEEQEHLEKEAARLRRSNARGAAAQDGELDPTISQISADLRQALETANHRKRDAQDRLRSYESQAESDEAELHAELRSARAALETVREDRANSARQDQHSRRVRSQLREVESERDAMARATRALQSELAEVHASIRAQEPDPVAAAAQAASMEAAETSLRAEAAALRSALALCEKRHQDNLRAQAREAEAMRSREAEQREEMRELEAAEEQLRLDRACAQDLEALRMAALSPVVGGVTPEDLELAAAQVEEREEECREAQAELEELHEEYGHLLRLNAAAEARIEEFEQGLSGGGLRATVERAVAALHRMDGEARAAGEEGLQGAARLVFVLAQVCGIPRMAYLALDSNHSGRVSMCEFDSGLRLRFGLDYEAVVAMPPPVLRPLFKEFDAKRRGYLAEEDFARCHPDLWAAYGRKGWPISGPEHHFAPPPTSGRRPSDAAAAPSAAPGPRNRSAPAGGRRR